MDKLKNGMIDNLKIGLAFSGGFARGASQIGFLRALREKMGRAPIATIAGSSIGAFMRHSRFS